MLHAHTWSRKQSTNNLMHFPSPLLQPHEQSTLHRKHWEKDGNDLHCSSRAADCAQLPCLRICWLCVRQPLRSTLYAVISLRPLRELGGGGVTYSKQNIHHRTAATMENCTLCLTLLPFQCCVNVCPLLRLMHTHTTHRSPVRFHNSVSQKLVCAL